MNIYTSELQSTIASTIKTFKDSGKVFVNTRLYIKRHTETEKCYFGKTIGSEYFLLNEYNGSGKHWCAHIKKHGVEHVETVWYQLFTDVEALVTFALSSSERWNILNDDMWLNLQIENGLDGGAVLSEETKDKIRATLAAKSPEEKAAIKAKKQATNDAQSPEEKAAIEGKIRATWDAKSPEENAAIEAKKQATWAAKSPEETAAIKAKKQATRDAKSPEEKAAIKAKNRAKSDAKSPEENAIESAKRSVSAKNRKRKAAKLLDK